MPNWKIRVYDDNEKVVESWVIKDRTSQEAHKEAMSEVEHRHPMCNEWTMMEAK